MPGCLEHYVFLDWKLATMLWDASRELQDFYRCSTEPRVDACGSQSIGSHGELWNDAYNNSLISGLLLISDSFFSSIFLL